MQDVTKTITITVIDEEKIRRHEVASMYAANARTKLMMANSPSMSDEQKLKLIREAKQDIQDGMSILRSGFIRPLGCYDLKKSA